MYGKSPLMISSTIAKKKAIKESNTPEDVNMLPKLRSETTDSVKQFLLIWINKKQMADQYRKSLYTTLTSKVP